MIRYPSGDLVDSYFHSLPFILGRAAGVQDRLLTVVDLTNGDASPWLASLFPTQCVCSNSYRFKLHTEIFMGAVWEHVETPKWTPLVREKSSARRAWRDPFLETRNEHGGDSLRSRWSTYFRSSVIIVLGGTVDAQHEAKELLRKFPYVEMCASKPTTPELLQMMEYQDIRIDAGKGLHYARKPPGCGVS